MISGAVRDELIARYSEPHRRYHTMTHIEDCLAQVAASTDMDDGQRALMDAALAHIAQDPPDVVVFLDADFSDVPEEIDRLLAPILAGEAELVIGSRTLGMREPGALLPQARFGNQLACGKHLGSRLAGQLVDGRSQGLGRHMDIEHLGSLLPCGLGHRLGAPERDGTKGRGKGQAQQMLTGQGRHGRRISKGIE